MSDTAEFFLCLAFVMVGLVLAISAYWFGRPRRIIAPIARDVPRRVPRPQAER